MVKVILISLFLVGCTTVPKIETKTVLVPTLFCPAPPENTKPNLPIYSISSRDDIGDVVVKYKATVRSLIDYSNRQESIIRMYKTLSETSTSLEKPHQIEIKEVKTND